MQGTEIGHLNAAIAAILNAHEDLSNATVDEAKRPVDYYGKGDTLGMDAIPEIVIVNALREHDRTAVIVTEERGSEGKIELTPVADPRGFRTVYISDPLDRSTQLKLALAKAPNNKKLREVFRDSDFRRTWEKEAGAPISITGATSAITCVRHGVPIFSVIVNHITHQLFVSCSAGNFMVNLPAKATKIDFDYIVAEKKGKLILFPGIEATDMRRFVTFMGKDGYLENLLSSKIVKEGDLKKSLHYGLPGGPSRALYLSSLQPAHKGKQVGFILANGEKIGEWIHWLPFIRFARSGLDMSAPALRMFEIWQDRPGTKDGILRANPPAYSVFKSVSETDQRMIVSNNVLANFPNPSIYRSTLIVASVNNRWTNSSAGQYGFRPIEFFSEE